MKMFACKLAQDEVTHQRLRVGFKKACPECSRRVRPARPQPFLRAERMRHS